METPIQPIQFTASSGTPHPRKALVSANTVKALFDLPFMELLFQAQQTHRLHFNPQHIQLSVLSSIKTGGCPEDCGYCPQSVHHKTAVENQPLIKIEEVIEAARQAKAAGASRFCMAAAWRRPKSKDLDKVYTMIRAVKALGLETCATLGMLKGEQAQALKAAGLDYYNHNVDTASHRYQDIISTRSYEDRLETLGYVREAGLAVCCGGIVGMGESRYDRAVLIAELANFAPQPESVPINHLVRVVGTPLATQTPLEWSEFVRTVAVARIVLPQSYVRLSAGRQEMHEAVQALCFLAGANAIFYGDKLLTTPNPQVEQDEKLLAKLDLIPQ
jgi:biotin synthase